MSIKIPKKYSIRVLKHMYGICPQEHKEAIKTAILEREKELLSNKGILK